MVKRILLILAMGAALVACSPSGSGSSTGTETLAPVDTSAPSEAAPSESAPEMSASPS
jgi:ABC-type glycerol-3-phosphate transport system substrate-binding protein